MTSPYEAPGADLWDLLGRLYILCLLLAPLFVRWRWGLRASLYWVGAAFLVVLAMSALIYLFFYPGWAPLPGMGAGGSLTPQEAMMLISGVAQLQMFVKLTLIIPAIAVICGAVLTLVASALLCGWRSLRSRQLAG